MNFQAIRPRPGHNPAARHPTAMKKCQPEFPRFKKTTGFPPIMKQQTEGIVGWSQKTFCAAGNL
jgi:hypothetical protein